MNDQCLKLGPNKAKDHFMKQINERIKWMWRFNSKFIMFSGVSMVTCIVLSVILCWITEGNFDPDYVYYPYKTV